MSIRKKIKDTVNFFKHKNMDAIFDHWNELHDKDDVDILMFANAEKNESFLEKYEDRYRKLTGHTAKYIKSHLEAQLQSCMKGKNIEKGFLLVLELLSLSFLLNKNFRKNIANFTADYVFTDKAQDFYVRASFKNEKMHVTRKKLDNPTFALIFKDTASFFKLITSKEPDLLNAMLNQDIEFTGNINYINKFAYMGQHLVLSITGGASFADDK